MPEPGKNSAVFNSMSMMDHVRESILVIDEKDKLQYFNKKAAALFRLKQKDLGENPNALLPLFQSSKAFKITFKNFNEDQLVQVDHKIKKATVHLELTGSYYGNDKFLMLSFVDITRRKQIESQLEEREAMYRQMIDLVPHAIFLKDNDRKFVVVNRAVAGYHNLEAKDMLGKRDEDIFDKDEYDDFIKVERDVLDNKKTIIVPDERFSDYMGNTRIIHSTKIPFHLTSKDEWGILGVNLDITEQKLAEAKIKEIETRFRSMVSNIPGIFYRVKFNTEEIFEYISDYVQITTGIPASDYIGKPLDNYRKLIHEEDREKVEKQVTAALKKKAAYNIEYRIRTKDNVIKWQYEEGRGVYGEDDKLKYLDAAVFDITERKKLEEEQTDLRLKHQRMLMNAVVKAQEKERKKVAEDLHDGLGQLLTATKMNLEAYHARAQNGSAENPSLLNASNLLSDAIHEVRNITKDLLPGSLKDFGLVTAVEKLCENMNALSDTHFFFHAQDIDGKLDATMEVNLYRVIQEIVNNILKHADAEEASIQLFKRKNNLILQAEDDGKGFDLAEQQRNSKGLGLKSIENRVELMDGTLDLDTSPGRGTSISIIINLENESL